MAKKTALSTLSNCVLFSLAVPLLASCTHTESAPSSHTASYNSSAIPANNFDLSYWKINVPVDLNNDNKIDEISVKDIQNYSHPDFFYLDKKGHMVFATPNKALTSATSSNTRSELRQMIRGTNTKIKTKGAANNFALNAHPLSESFGEIGGRMEATLKVDHVALRAKNPMKPPAFSVVVGQIHAGKDKALIEKGLGYGWGNEPIKIYFKKWPGHEKGSVFWNYERNLEKNNPDRTDIVYPVWGNVWTESEDPKDNGIALGDEFSYVINVHENTMQLTFMAEGKPTVNYSIDLSNNVNAYGEIDEKDHPHGYTGDWLYFKAGAYNQCSTKDASGIWYAGCLGTGDWQTDKRNGDYTQVTFSKLTLKNATPLK